MRSVDLGPFTEEDMIALFHNLLDTMPENLAIELIHAWIQENGLDGEFSEDED